MKWFKHYSNARLSNALTEIKANFGLEGYGRYWLLLELMSEKFDGTDDQVFVFETKKLREDLGFYHTNGMLMYLECLVNLCVMSFECRSNVIEINTDIMLKLQGRDWKNNKKKRVENAPKNKNKNKNKKEINILSGKPDDVAELRSQVIEYLNLKTGKNFSPKSNLAKKYIGARAAEGYSLEQFKYVIDVKSQEWIGTPEEKYVRPETLFGNKFDGYLNQTIVKPEKSTAQKILEMAERARH